MRSGLVLIALLSQALSAQSRPEVRKALTRALPVLERSASTFIAKRACISCHHNILPILMLHLARDRGMEIDSALLSTVEEKTFQGLRSPGAIDDAIQATSLNDPTPNESFLLMAAHAAGLEPGLTTGVYARRLASWQRNGHWVTSDFRPPHSSSRFTATATAIRAIRLYMPEKLRAERDACIQRARQWLVATAPASTEDAAFRLLGLVWAGAPSTDIDAARKDLAALQKPAGGWPELPRYQPDAYSTGEALFALHEAGLPAGDGVWAKGMKFLVSTQAPDGTWRVRTRMISPASVSPAYFPSGFPYQKDEYLSYAGSCWAVMALLGALPESASKLLAPVLADSGAAEAPTWVRTALFGSPQELAALLDRGLDPNSKTKSGTTLLMMAAPDAEKVRLLLARGADAKARAASGCDALTIAAAYRASAAALGSLLDAGAEMKPPEGVRTRNVPLVFASMTGDLENVKLLLARGADPSAGTRANTPLGAAVTFGYLDEVRTLLAAGAPAGMTESTGINLIHWAVITDHPEVIPALVEAGVPLNAVDESGYTPLIYSATIDFGDAEAVKILLQAGADRNIRNGEGRTALEQARHYGHALLEAALR
jgi:ankyrin repeat protein